MKNIWDEREKALENEYIYRQEREKIEKLKEKTVDEIARTYCKNRCPKCGDPLQAMTFRGVPLDKCGACGGVWLGPKDLQMLAENDHRTWFDKWFKMENEEKVEVP